MSIKYVIVIIVVFTYVIVMIVVMFVTSNYVMVVIVVMFVTSSYVIVIRDFETGGLYILVFWGYGGLNQRPGGLDHEVMIFPRAGGCHGNGVGPASQVLRVYCMAGGCAYVSMGLGRQHMPVSAHQRILASSCCHNCQVVSGQLSLFACLGQRDGTY